MENRIFGFSSNSLSHIAFGMLNQTWAVSDRQRKTRATKAKNYMRKNDYMCILGTRKTGSAGLVAVGQIKELPVFVTQENGSIEGILAPNYPLWGALPWYMPFKVDFLHP